MLVRGETFNQRKKSLLEMVAVNRQLIRVYNQHIKDHPDEDNSVYFERIAEERAIIKDTMNEIVQLKRWQKKRVYEQSRLSKEAGPRA